MTFRLISDPSTDRTFASLKEAPEEIKRGLRRGAYIVGKELVTKTIKAINKKPKSGRIYTIYRGIGGRVLKRPRRHKASAPGEAPAVISGRLRKSVDFKVRGSKRLEFGAGNSRVKYARILELGGNAGRGGRSKIAARKYLRTSIDQLDEKVKTVLTREVTKLIKK